jgi:hypothetical protein
MNRLNDFLFFARPLCQRTALALLTLGLASVVCAQTPAPSNPEIDKAILPAPQNMKAGATVIKWKPDLTYDTIRQGTNRLVCFDRSGHPRQQPFSVECTSIANLKRVAQNMKFEAIDDAKERQAAFDAAEKDGTREKPEFGSAWIHLQGRDQATARLHTTIAVPMATAQSMGLPDNPSQGGIWIMNAGTTTAHLMIPGQ